MPLNIRCSACGWSGTFTPSQTYCPDCGRLDTVLAGLPSPSAGRDPLSSTSNSLHQRLRGLQVESQRLIALAEDQLAALQPRVSYTDEDLEAAFNVGCALGVDIGQDVPQDRRSEDFVAWLASYKIERSDR